MTLICWIFHTSDSHKCTYGSQWGSLAAASVYKKFYYESHENLYQYCKLHENPYQYVLKVMRESVSVLQVTCIAFEHEIKGSYDKITIVSNYTRKYHLLVCCLWQCYSCCSFVTIQTVLYYMAYIHNSMQPVYHRAADVPDFLGSTLKLIDSILHHLGSFVLRRAEMGYSKLLL